MDLEDAAGAGDERHLAHLEREGRQHLLRHPGGAQQPVALRAIGDGKFGLVAHGPHYWRRRREKSRRPALVSAQPKLHRSHGGSDAVERALDVHHAAVTGERGWRGSQRKEDVGPRRKHFRADRGTSWGQLRTIATAPFCLCSHERTALPPIWKTLHRGGKDFVDVPMVPG